MSFKEPTFEEYKLATTWARFKYKYGIVVVVLCWLLLILLCFFVYNYGEELSRNPLNYGAEKFNVECHCYNYETPINPIEFYVNGSTIWTIKNKKW